VTALETDTLPRGLNEEIIRMISARQNEPQLMLYWRPKTARPLKFVTTPM
jgi:Fe-S cluster assembly protein SufB